MSFLLITESLKKTLFKNIFEISNVEQKSWLPELQQETI